MPDFKEFSNLINEVKEDFKKLKEDFIKENKSVDLDVDTNRLVEDLLIEDEIELLIDTVKYHTDPKLSNSAACISNKIMRLTKYQQALLSFDSKLFKYNERIKSLKKEIFDNVSNSSNEEFKDLIAIFIENANDHFLATFEKLKDLNYLIKCLGKDCEFQKALNCFEKTLFLLNKSEFEMLIADTKIKVNHELFHSYDKKAYIARWIKLASLIPGLYIPLVLFFPLTIFIMSFISHRIDDNHSAVDEEDDLRLIFVLGWIFLVLLTIAITTILCGFGVIVACLAVISLIPALIGIAIAIPSLIIEDHLLEKKKALVILTESDEVPVLSRLELPYDEYYSLPGHGNKTLTTLFKEINVFKGKKISKSYKVPVLSSIESPEYKYYSLQGDAKNLPIFFNNNNVLRQKKTTNEELIKVFRNVHNETKKNQIQSLINSKLAHLIKSI